MATAVLDHPGALGDPADQEDAVFPCKGCGEILEEGKAFELAGNRWHINCFRCNTCSVLLDSDANLLLLGDGSLICNNCTYSCSACGNKIEDLAILTGDQAYCASCFKCRNCKRKIDNLRYARTSQGIFCMSCHETLMARRRKKNKGQRAPSANSNSSSTRPDKALPDLPKPLAQAEPKSAFSADEESIGSPDPSDSNAKSRKDAGYVDYKRTADDDKGSPVPRIAKMLNLESIYSTLANQMSNNPANNSILPSSTYSSVRAASSTSNTNTDGFTTADDDKFFMPITLDPTPAPDATTRNGQSRPGLPENYRDDYRDLLASTAATRSGSQERRNGKSSYSSPHIAFQEKGRQPSTDGPRRNLSGPGTPRSPVAPAAATGNLPAKALTSPNLASGSEAFKLAEAPKRKSSTSKNTSPNLALSGQTDGSDVKEQTPPMPEHAAERPVRGDSLNRNNLKQSVPDRKAVPRPDGELEEARRQMEAPKEDPNISAPFNVTSSREMNGGPPPRNASRPGTSDVPADFTAPRSAPAPPKHRPNESITSIQSEANFSSRDPGTPLPPHTATGSFSMEDEMGRILRGENDEHPGLFRKMSKAVKHGRSQSDKIASSPSPKWARGSRNGSVDISSPLIQGAGVTVDDPATLRNKLRYAEQRIAELEAEKLKMEEGQNSTAELQQMNSELRQKRTTMAFLDTQREMVSRELDVMTEHLQKAKNGTPIDANKFKSEVLADLQASLTKLKEQQGNQIEDLMAKKNELTQEITTLIQMKDKGFQEYESLSTKNRELREMNDRVLESIREMSELGKLSPNSNALGIYTANYGRDAHSAGGSQTDIRNLEPTSSMLSGDTELETPTVMTAPKVVDIRKGQPKKFNWKKGGDRLAKNVSKGLKGAFGSTGPSTVREEQFTETLPYGAQQAGAPPMIGDLPAQGGRGDKRGFFGQLGQNNPRIGSPVSTQISESGTLFGSDLTGRCDFEQRIIPNVITRCIEEVEARGMDAEGIYRKSGSTSMVNALKAGFEATDKNDISDPDIDIHAVTSCVKQYLRKLPIPLITWDAYDPLLVAAAQEDHKDRIRALQKVVWDLPERHRDALEFLMGHLSRVVEMEPQNLMTPTNVGVVFAPTIMRPRQLEREISDMELQRKSVELLLINYAEVFETARA